MYYSSGFYSFKVMRRYKDVVCNYGRILALPVDVFEGNP
jgi:hypothetical protein